MAIETNHHDIEQCAPHICRKGFKKRIVIPTNILEITPMTNPKIKINFQVTK